MLGKIGLPSLKPQPDMSVLPFRSLYVHIPFCEAKCDYCAFYSEPASSAELRQKYLSRLAEEFAQKSEHCLPLRSIFLGGGTPSCLNAAELKRLLSLIQQYFRFVPDCEFSMEANPNSLNEEKIRIASELGINRLSLGVQSFQPAIRQILGRRGSLQNLPEILRLAEKYNLKNLNIDLIYNIPGQTRQDWKKDLQLACALQPSHLSAYALMLEEHTPLAKRLSPQDDDDEFCNFWNLTDEVLATKKLARYEISNFSRPGCQCRHNNEVWHGQTYLGCGPAAVSFDGENRPANPANLQDWLKNATQTQDILTQEQRAAEILAFGLRTLAGWNCTEFQQLTGFTPRKLRANALTRLEQLELLEITENYIRPTAKGLLFNDDILESLI
ncbi:MAG: radical SAM family heme chaperone HemW [Lentisphaeria bacterium]